MKTPVNLRPTLTMVILILLTVLAGNELFGSNGIPGYRYTIESDSSDFYLIRSLQERLGSPALKNTQILTPVGGAIWSATSDVVIVDSFAFLLSANGLLVYNVDSPAGPVLRRRFVLDGGTMYEPMIQAGRFLFVARTELLLVVDISNPLDPVVVNTLYHSGLIFDLRIEANQLFVGIARYEAEYAPYPSFHIYALADTVNPVSVGKYETTLSHKDARSIEIAGQYAYAADYWDHRIEIVDISSPTRPARIAEVATPYPTLLTRHGNRLYAYGDDRFLRTFSIEVPTAPVLLDSIAVFRMSALLWRDSTLFATAYEPGVPMEPSYAVAYRLGPDGLLSLIGMKSAMRDAARGLAIRDTVLFTVDYYNPLTVFNISNPAAMSVISQIPVSAVSLVSMSCQGQYGYVSSGRGRLCLVSLADTAHPVYLGYYPTERGNPGEVVASNDLLFWQNCWSTRIYSLADPAAPQYLTLFPADNNYSTGFAVCRNNRLYLSSTRGLIIADISDPSAPVEIGGGVADGMNARGLYVLGNIMYYPSSFFSMDRSNQYQFLTIDISNADQAVILDSINYTLPPEIPFGIAFSRMERRNNLIYGAFGTFGFWIIDISNPTRPDVVNRYYKDDWVYADVASKRNYLFVAASSQLEIYDLANPVQPRRIQVLPLGAPAQRIDILGDYLYLVESTGIVTFEINLPAVACGDVDASGIVTISDAVSLIQYIFGGGIPPDPLGVGDVDCSGSVTISDVVTLINYIFAGGPAPCAACP